MEAPDFWNDSEKSQDAMKELKNLKDDIANYNELKQEYEDIETLITMGYEENDSSLIQEIDEAFQKFQMHFDDIRISTLLSDKYDKDNAMGCHRNHL